jgi:hypothetical protein
MKTYVHVAGFFLEWEIFQAKDAEKIKIHISYLITFSENRAL